MRKRPIHDDIKDIAHINESLFKMKLEEASNNKSPNFSITGIEKVMKNL